jgi:hypothetical protein
MSRSFIRFAIGFAVITALAAGSVPVRALNDPAPPSLCRPAQWYQFERGDGQDTLVDNDATAGNTDVLRFLGGIKADQLWFQRSGNDLQVSLIGTGDRVTVQNWYSSTANQVEQIRAGDNKLLLNTPGRQAGAGHGRFCSAGDGAGGSIGRLCGRAGSRSCRQLALGGSAPHPRQDNHV